MIPAAGAAGEQRDGNQFPPRDHDGAHRHNEHGCSAPKPAASLTGQRRMDREFILRR